MAKKKKVIVARDSLESVPVLDETPKRVKYGSVTDEMIAKALFESHGLQWLAAEAVGISGSSMCVRIKNSPYLQEALKHAIERRVDRAERALRNLIEEKEEFPAICFFLKTRGKHRGYEETSTLSVDPDVLSKYTALMDAIKSSQDSNSSKSKESDE